MSKKATKDKVLISEFESSYLGPARSFAKSNITGGADHTN